MSLISAGSISLDSTFNQLRLVHENVFLQILNLCENGISTLHRVHRVVTSAFWRTFSIHEGKISLGWWGWGVHAHPLLLHLPSPVKLQCTLQLNGQIHWPCFISRKDMYSVGISIIHPGRRYAAGKNISFQARTFCSVPERFVPNVHFWPEYNLNLIN